MDKVKYYYDLIMHTQRSTEDWVALEREILEWFNTASSDEQRAFVESGAGETLSMLCS